MQKFIFQLPPFSDYEHLKDSACTQKNYIERKSEYNIYNALKISTMVLTK